MEAVRFKRQVLNLGRNTGEIQAPMFREELKHCERLVHKLVRRDVQSHSDDLLRQLQASGEISNHRLVYRF